MYQLSIRNQYCPNGCKGQVYIHSQKKQRLQCAKCKRTWAVYSNEYYFGLRLSREKVNRTIELIQRRIPVRNIAKFIGISPSTVQRWKSLSNKHEKK